MEACRAGGWGGVSVVRGDIVFRKKSKTAPRPPPRPAPTQTITIIASRERVPPVFHARGIARLWLWYFVSLSQPELKKRLYKKNDRALPRSTHPRHHATAKKQATKRA